MRNKELLLKLLNAETEEAALATLRHEGLLDDPSRWRALGNMRNNQSVVQAQQSSSAAALVEKFTNGLDAILIRRCRASGVDPRGKRAPPTMAEAVKSYFGDLSGKTTQEIRALAEETLVLYATGSKARPSISFFDAGEGQLPEDFPSTFCSLIYGSSEGSYKGAIPFVQGRFNMGGTGVLPFCGDQRKLQLIVSRVPSDVIQAPHEWGFTVFCYFSSKSSPEWRYLVGPDGHVFTAGSDPVGLVPKLGAKSGEICAPRERAVTAGTLIKLYDYKAPKSNICGELFKKIEEFLLVPALPLRIVECREAYKAKVMGVTVWDRLSAWSKDRIEEGFTDGASMQVELSNGEVVPAEIRVFKNLKGSAAEEDLPQTGLRALINGQSHGRRDTQFFRTKAVSKEHIAGSMLVTLDCTGLGQDTRNAIFMSNRETFREDPLLNELLRKIQKELHDHPGLDALNKKRYFEKIANATSDDDGLSALEDLLSTDPTLADLFGSDAPGRVAAKTMQDRPGDRFIQETIPFEGKEFPTYFRRANGSTKVYIEIPQGSTAKVRFQTDVKNNYFSRSKHRGTCKLDGDITPSLHLFEGKLTFSLSVKKTVPIGTSFNTKAVISDNAGHGPFTLEVGGVVVAARPKRTHQPPEPRPPTADKVPSRPQVIEISGEPEDPPLRVERHPETSKLQITINTGSRLLKDAKTKRPPEEGPAVEFVFKFGLALAAMGLLETFKKTQEWETEEHACRKKIEEAAVGLARVVVPMCLTLPKKLPKVA